MKTNVGNMAQDTTTTFATLIGVWINDAYQDAQKRGLWSDIIDDDYTFESVVDQVEYDLPSDFSKEIFVADIANGHPLTPFSEKQWWRRRAGDYQADSLDSGNPSRYVILKEAGKIKLDPPADTAETYAMPYQTTVTDLSLDADTSSITTISTYLEFYAIGMAQAYKGFMDRSEWWLNRAEFELRKRIKEEYTRVNQRVQRRLADWKMSDIKYLVGEKSYDSI